MVTVKGGTNAMSGIGEEKGDSDHMEEKLAGKINLWLS